MRSLPGMDIWQTEHVTPGSVDRSDQKDYNSPEELIANVSDKNDTLRFIKLEANPDSSFVVTNSRNGYTVKYPAHE